MILFGPCDKAMSAEAVYATARFESMSFVVNILACKLKIVNNKN